MFTGDRAVPVPPRRAVRDVHREVAGAGAEGDVRSVRAARAGRHTGAHGVPGSRAHRLLPARARAHTEGPAPRAPRDKAQPQDHAASVRSVGLPMVSWEVC